MLKAITSFSVALTLIACANQNISKELLNKDLLNEAQPIYATCLADYKKTLSDKEAKENCTKNLKASYKKVTQK